MRHRREIEAIHADDPHPPSTILGDTYSLGVMALCLERDVLVDVAPHVQMREKWRPLDPASNPEEINKYAIPIPPAQKGIAFFDGRFAATSSTLAPGRNISSLQQRQGKAPVVPMSNSLIERYLRPVRQREKCSKDDALDVDAIKELEREWALQTSGPELIHTTDAGASAIPPKELHSAVKPHSSPELDFLMDDGGG